MQTLASNESPRNPSVARFVEGERLSPLFIEHEILLGKVSRVGIANSVLSTPVEFELKRYPHGSSLLHPLSNWLAFD
jgi:hypothetical protein